MDDKKLAETLVSLDSLPSGVTPHTDDYAVDAFAGAMKRKLALKRRQGKAGWDNHRTCSQDRLSRMLREHVEKGDPVDVANFCMMLHQRGERIAKAANQTAAHSKNPPSEPSENIATSSGEVR